MKYKDVELHTINDLVTMYDTEVFSRFPQNLHESLHHTMGYQMCGTEIRFVPLEKVFITIGSRFSYIQPKCLVYYGSHLISEEYCINREITITVNPYEVMNVQAKNLSEKLRKDKGFSIEVVRIVLLGEAFYIRSIHGSLRPPKDDEVPSKKILSYGTSITQGIGCTSPDLSYPWMLAHRLGYDSFNYGMSGNAFCEKETIDFLANSGTYDLITLELSVNMLGNGYTRATFLQRVHELLDKLSSKNSNACILGTGILTYFEDYDIPNEGQIATAKEYRDGMSEVFSSFNNPKIRYVEPMKVLSAANLSSDLIHPGNQGMIELAERFYQAYQDDDT